VPERGEIIRHASGVEFEVMDADSRRVKRLRISDTWRKPMKADKTVLNTDETSDDTSSRSKL